MPSVRGRNERRRGAFGNFSVDDNQIGGILALGSLGRAGFDRLINRIAGWGRASDRNFRSGGGGLAFRRAC